VFRTNAHRFTVFLAGCVLMASPPGRAAPSFDCRQAGHAIEKLICSDAKLSALDAKMAELFSDVMRQAKGSTKAELLSEQRGWIKNRNGCAKRSEPRRNCVLEHYTQRSSRLEELLAEGAGTASAADAPSARFHCDDGSDIAATFLPGKPSRVRVVRGTSTWTLPQAVAGSGARYAKNGVVFWTKGHEALFEQGDQTVNCRQRR
jgi:uncharacterized protein